MHECKSMKTKQTFQWILNMYCEQERKKGHTSKVSRKQDNQESILKHKSKQGITIKPNHEQKMVETSQGCNRHSNCQVFRFVFTLKSTS